jgi:hypothetical protein
MKELKIRVFGQERWMTLTLTEFVFQGQRSPNTFQLVSSLYDKWFTSYKFLRKNHKVSRAITLSRIIEHAIQKRSVVS